MTVELNAAAVPEALVSLQSLLAGGRVTRAMESGFPLYVEYRVALRESRSWKDRTVRTFAWDYVVLYDPVREVFVVEQPDSTIELPTPRALSAHLASVYVVGLEPDEPGSYYYEAVVSARTLSDEDVDEVFAWLKGAGGDSARVHRPGFITRAARRMLVRVVPLPQMQLKGRSPDFRFR